MKTHGRPSELAVSIRREVIAANALPNQVAKMTLDAALSTVVSQLRSMEQEDDIQEVLFSKRLRRVIASRCENEVELQLTIDGCSDSIISQILFQVRHALSQWRKQH